MDQQKIGEFLKLLRKEKGLTQEQLAECMNVSTRTVSRWETGTNLPELDMMIRLAERYEVSVGEVLDGERTARKDLDKFSEVSIENVSEASLEMARETIVKAADYSKINEKQLLIKLINIMSIGMAAWIISFLFFLMFARSVKGVGLLLGCESVMLLIYGVIMFWRKVNHSINGILYGAMGAGVAVALSNIVLAVLFFGSGSYHNYGIQGAYYAIFVVGSIFMITGVVTRWIIIKNQKFT